MKFTTEVEITEARASDILCDAFEGGSNYWIANISYYFNGKHVTSKEAREALKNENIEGVDKEDPPYIWLPLFLKGEVRVQVSPEGDSRYDNKWFKLNAGTLRAGLATMAQKFPKHFADIVNENDDAITGDVLLQCCLFEDIIFG